MRLPAVRLAVRVTVSLLAAGFLASGCTHATPRPASSEPPASARADAPGTRDITGTYALVSINDHSLPFVMTNEPPGVRVTGGSFTISADGTCGSTIAYVMPSGQSGSRDVRATWIRDGSRLTMTWQGAGTTTGTVEGDRFSMKNEGQEFTYRRAH